MFKFNFDLDLEEGPSPQPQALSVQHRDVTESINHTHADTNIIGKERQTWEELKLDDLLETLPPVLSYSPITIPLPPLPPTTQVSSSDSSNVPERSTPSGSRSITLPRRDLFDARYQLLSEDNDNAAANGQEHSEVEKDEVEFFENPSDLVPGVYEGGLKTWECALTLVEALERLRLSHESERGGPRRIRGKRIFEIGCGTAIPSTYLLYRLFEEIEGDHDEERRREETTFVLQDYNALVLRLVTLPNLLLTWYASPSAKSLREEREKSVTASADDDNPPFHSTKPGDLHITPELITAFKTSLSANSIILRLIAGSWDALLETNPSSSDVHPSLVLDGNNPFNVILTSETIYQPSSLDTLVRLLQCASGVDTRNSAQSTTDLAEGEEAAKGIQSLSLNEGADETRSRQGLCLVAAKVLYFGVGGGITDFERCVGANGGRMSTVLHHETGVGRKVLRVTWSR